MQFKARIIDIEAGRHEIAINEQEAKQLDVELMDRVKVKRIGKEVTAIVTFSKTHVWNGEVEIFSETAAELNLNNGDYVEIQATSRPQSLDFIKKKLDKQIIQENEINSIISDLMQERLSDVELSVFISAIYSNGLTMEETISLTNAIYNSGDKLQFEGMAISEHGIGGVAGDRVSMLIVPIIASLGLKIPKTATRAISSASGTADCMEVLASVSFNSTEIKKIVEKTNGCIVWGGAINIATADDKLIRIRRPLRLDPESLLLSSIIAKKKAEGATHILLDIPAGKGSKVETVEEARNLAKNFRILGTKMNLNLDVIITDGSNPVSNSVGPLLEAKTVLEELENKNHSTLSEKSLLMSARILQMVKGINLEDGYRIAKQQLFTGKAHEKFMEIIEAQNGKKIESSELQPGEFHTVIKSKKEGRVAHVSSSGISKICRFLGAPEDKKAGMKIKVKAGENINEDQELVEMFSSSKQKLDDAINQFDKNPMIEIEEIIIE
ncbi:MAG: thymidine phosphorylase [Candidatus Marsarchaeota archaeon]|nr:thymidine phosphorylase [Candidatus Marsarchaeota archaeon]